MKDKISRLEKGPDVHDFIFLHVFKEIKNLQKLLRPKGF